MAYFDLRMHNPAEYIIQVVGALGEEWSGRLGGLTVATTEEADQQPVTTLTGQLADQAALLGVLNGLYNMRLPVLSVECTDCAKLDTTEQSDFGKSESESLL